jgi:hypothetical protein
VKERLHKANQDLEKQLVEVKEREKKERAGREQREAQERERQARSDQEKVAREKLQEGPDLPASIPQPIYCPTQDEGAAGVDIFIHCAPQSQIKAKELALYYRPSGALHFNSLLMERSRKGWYVATIPGARVTGRMLQYYVEARGPKGDVAAVNGKPTSPNVMMIRPRATSSEAPAPAGTRLSAVTRSTASAKSAASRRERGKSR